MAQLTRDAQLQRLKQANTVTRPRIIYRHSQQGRDPHRENPKELDEEAIEKAAGNGVHP